MMADDVDINKSYLLSGMESDLTARGYAGRYHLLMLVTAPGKFCNDEV